MDKEYSGRMFLEKYSQQEISAIFQEYEMDDRKCYNMTKSD